MNQKRLYLDYNASAPLLDRARTAMLAAMDAGGNASSVYHEGRNARKQVEFARNQVAALVGSKPDQVIFTSGASEAANMALSTVIRNGGKDVRVSRLFVSAIEHPCVLAGGRFSEEEVETIPVTADGLVDLPALEAALATHDRFSGVPMVAIMLANNETGVIQPVQEAAELVKKHNGILVVDAVQALGRIPIDIAALSGDFFLFSAHKAGGPQGAGALVLGNASRFPLPLIKGGGQENFRRAGTENVAAIAGFGAACEWHLENLIKKVQISPVRDQIEAGLAELPEETKGRVPPPVVHGKGAPRLMNTVCFSIPGVRAETVLMALDLAGISASSGSACSSGKLKRSHVLEAMGVDGDLLEGALRISTGWETEAKDAERFLNAIRDHVDRLFKDDCEPQRASAQPKNLENC